MMLRPLFKRLGQAGMVLSLGGTTVVVSAMPAFAADPPTLNTTNIQNLSNGLAWWALIVCVGGICVSSALWAMGSKGQNPGQELTGKKGIVLCCTAAFFVGALPSMINWFEGAANDPSISSWNANGSVPNSACQDSNSAQCNQQFLQQFPSPNNPPGANGSVPNSACQDSNSAQCNQQFLQQFPSPNNPPGAGPATPTPTTAAPNICNDPVAANLPGCKGITTTTALPFGPNNK